MVTYCPNGHYIPTFRIYKNSTCKEFMLRRGTYENILFRVTTSITVIF